MVCNCNQIIDFPLFFHSVTDNANIGNGINFGYGYDFSFDYGNGFTSTVTEKLTSNYWAESTCSDNRYTYAMNNPMNCTDPSGEFFIWSILTAVVDLVETALFRGGLDPTSKSSRQEAWRNYDPSAPWSKTNKAWQIDLGVFRPDPNLPSGGGVRAREVVQRLFHPQTYIGYYGAGALNLQDRVESVTNWGGTTHIETRNPNWKYGSGLGLPPYTFGQSGTQADPDDRLFQHEFGHVLQSRESGPFYLFRYGIPSAFGSGNHNDKPVEQDANIRAYMYFNSHIENYSGWDYGYNSIIGYDQTLGYNHADNQAALIAGRIYTFSKPVPFVPLNVRHHGFIPLNFNYKLFWILSLKK